MQGTSIIKTAYSHAISDWFNRQDKIMFFYSEDAVSVLSTYNESSSSDYGRCETVTNNNGELIRFTAYVNASNTNITKTNIARSVAGHELGHAVGLADLDSGDTTVALMNQSRDRSTIYFLQTDDINGVNAHYK